MEAICLDKYAGKAEAVVVRRLVRKALALGYSISVNDGEEWTVKRSINRMEILAALATTEADTLLFRSADGEKAGSMWLVYQGGDNPGDEVIADHTENEVMCQLYDAATGKE